MDFRQFHPNSTRRFVLTILALALPLASTSAFGARHEYRHPVHRRKHRHLETFRATIGGPSLEVISSAPGYRGPRPVAAAAVAPVRTDTLITSQADAIPAPTEGASEIPPPSSIRVTATARAPIAAAESLPPVPISPAPKRTAGLNHFDPVPNSQVEPLIRRLHLVEELVAKYGRAYDYRMLTVMQLQDIVTQLDTQAAEATELQRRMNTRNEIKRGLEQSESSDLDHSLGSEAPDANTSRRSGSRGADTIAPVTGP